MDENIHSEHIFPITSCIAYCNFSLWKRFSAWILVPSACKRNSWFKYSIPLWECAHAVCREREDKYFPLWLNPMKIFCNIELIEMPIVCETVNVDLYRISNKVNKIWKNCAHVIVIFLRKIKRKIVFHTRYVVTVPHSLWFQSISEIILSWILI